MISGSGYLDVAGQQDTAGRDGTAKPRARERQGRHRLGGFIWRSGAILAPRPGDSRHRTFVPASWSSADVVRIEHAGRSVRAVHVPGGTSSQPSRSARVASSVRDAMSNRSNSRRRCDSTVFAPIPSRAAISSFERPSTTSAHDVELALAQPHGRAGARPDAERQPAGRGPPDRVDELGDRARS